MKMLELGGTSQRPNETIVRSLKFGFALSVYKYMNVYEQRGLSIACIQHIIIVRQFQKRVCVPPFIDFSSVENLITREVEFIVKAKH